VAGTVVEQRGGVATGTNLSVFSVALKALTQRTRSVSVTSVVNLFLATENTERTFAEKQLPEN
jgi:hypothetical protein